MQDMGSALDRRDEKVLKRNCPGSKEEGESPRDRVRYRAKEKVRAIER